jgi:hypothetical protein
MQIAALDNLYPMAEDYFDTLGRLEGAVAHHAYEEQHGFVQLEDEAPPADQTVITARYAEERHRCLRGGEGASPSHAGFLERGPAETI